MTETNSSVLRQSAESLYRSELESLAASDKDPRPEGWKLSPKAVRRFLLGDAKAGIERKFYGDDPLVDRCIVTLMGNQGLMLVGEPGTAKSLLSELLAAAISGDSGLVVQGTAGTTEDHLRYSWNYAMLLSSGPSRQSLVPSPFHQAMESGKLVRFEEITRCPPEIQDVMISLLSEKMLLIPELGEGARLHAKRGFNVIATANLRDRGVHEMSSALKRRFNYETVQPIKDLALETELVGRRVEKELARNAAMPSGKPALQQDLIEMLVTVFQELRSGRTREGTAIKTPETVLSTAEAVNVAHAAVLESRYLGNGQVDGGALARQLMGVALKGDPEDARKLKQYMETVVKERSRKGEPWKSFWDASRPLWN
ncbi:MAG: hypothetical protein RL318_725 [Fibrobacterota bacterium]|jgi:MoxR-like ATPase